MATTTVSKDSNFNSLITDVETYKSDLLTFKSKVTSSSKSTMDTVRGTVFMGSWEDDAADKFKNFARNTVQHAGNVLYRSATAGDFVEIVDLLDNLKTCLVNCRDKKFELQGYYTSRRYIQDHEPTVEQEDWHGNNSVTRTVANPKIAMYTQKIETAKGELDDLVTEANGYITSLDALSFDPDTSGDGSSGGSDGSGGSGDSKSGGVPAGDGPTVNKGDTVVVSDTEGNTKTMVYYGTTEDGVNLYVDTNGGRDVYAQYPNGTVFKTNGTETSLSNGSVNIGGGRLVGLGDLSSSMNIYTSNPQCQVVGQGSTSRQNAAQGDPFDKPTPYSPSSEPLQTKADSTKRYGGANGGGGQTRGGGAGRDASPEASPSASPTPVTVTVGDIVTVNGRAGTYLGTTEGGTNIYSDTETNWIFYQQSDGTVSDSNADYSHYYDYGANINGQVVSPGDTYRTRTYSDGDTGFTYVSSGGEDSSNFNPYVEG